MKTDTAHEHWNAEWRSLAPDSKWATPEPEVLDWAAGFSPGAAVLDLGAGVGRHALALARLGHRVTASDLAEGGLAAIRATAEAEGLEVATATAPMTEQPFESGTFDHVLSWNVIYHGDRTVVAAAIAEIARLLKPGGSFLGTMLSARRLPVERAKAPGRQIGPGTWVFEGEGDKGHPHFFCDAAELLALFTGFEPWHLEDREHDSPGSWHWHLTMERR